MRAFILVLFGFLRNVWGVVHKPYAAYRTLVKDDPYQLVIIFSLIGGYFFFVSPLKLHTFHPFLLTLNASRLFTVALMTYIGICFLLLKLGRLAKGEGNLRGVLMGWGYSLLPTLIWFLVTSLFYVVLPPPRHETFLGKGFSLLFITFSLSLLFWKGLLYYLTLRFALKLKWRQVLLVSFVFFPALALYVVVMYHFGIFRVPFV